jgi:threonine-phosphate decarboxylase
MIQNKTYIYINFLFCVCQHLHNAFMTDYPIIGGIDRIFMAFDFPDRVVHGGTGKLQREKTHKYVLDFSASTNPYPPLFSWTPEPSDLSYYPDDNYTELKERIGKYFNRDPSEICVGNGSIELIRVFCAVIFRDPSRKKLFFTDNPTFGEYALSARLVGAKQTSHVENAGVEFLCNPNNPTGILMKKADVLNRLQSHKDSDSFLFCDEAFIELSDPRESIADIKEPGLFVLRSLTKSFSVPGIRFGYGFANAALIEQIEIARSPWSVNAFAESYAMEAILHLDELITSRSAIERERTWLVEQILPLDLLCFPSSANYLLVNCRKNVGPLCKRLERNGILVRDCTSFGLPECIRIAVRTHEENIRLVEALVACVH